MNNTALFPGNVTHFSSPWHDFEILKAEWTRTSVGLCLLTNTLLLLTNTLNGKWEEHRHGSKKFCTQTTLAHKEAYKRWSYINNVFLNETVTQIAMQNELETQQWTNQMTHQKKYSALTTVKLHFKTWEEILTICHIQKICIVFLYMYIYIFV